MTTAVAAALLLASLALTPVLCRGVVVNPLVVFSGVWLIDLALYDLDRVFGFFYVQLSEYAGLLLSLSLLLVFIGTALGLIVASDRIREDSPEVEHDRLGGLVGLTYVLTVIAAIAALWRYQTAVSAFGPLFENITRLRAASFSGVLTFSAVSRVLSLLGYVAVLNCGVLLGYRWVPKLAAAAVVVVAADFFNDAAVGMRGSTMNAILLLVTATLLALAIKRQRLRIIHLVAAGGTMLAGIALITVILYLRSGSPISYWGRLVTDNYVYLVGTVPSLSVFVANPWPVIAPGQYTFLALFQVVDWLGQSVSGMSPFAPGMFATYYAPVTTLGPFNASGYLAYFYGDLREPGVIVLSLVMGFASGYAFMKALRRKRIVDIQVASLFLFLLIFSIRGVETSGIWFWMTLLAIGFQHWALRIRWR